MRPNYHSLQNIWFFSPNNPRESTEKLLKARTVSRNEDHLGQRRWGWQQRKAGMGDVRETEHAERWKRGWQGRRKKETRGTHPCPWLDAVCAPAAEGGPFPTCPQSLMPWLSLFPRDHSPRLAPVPAPFLKGWSDRSPDGLWAWQGGLANRLWGSGLLSSQPQAPARDSLPDMTLQMLTHPPPKPDLFPSISSIITHQSVLPLWGLGDRRKSEY